MSNSTVRYPVLVAPSTALVVIDMQNVFMLPGMPVEVPAARDIVPNINRLSQSVRSHGGKVVWVQMTVEGEEDKWSVFFSGTDKRPVAKAMRPGSHGYELHADLGIDAADLFIQKKRFSAFLKESSDIDSRLRDLGVDTVIIAGTLTNVCCESSARDAMMMNYKVIFAADANAALNQVEHQATLTTIGRIFGDVASVDEIIGRF